MPLEFNDKRWYGKNLITKSYLLGDPGLEKLAFASPAGIWKKFDGWEKCKFDEYDWLPSVSWGSMSGTGLGSLERESGVTRPPMPLWLGEAGADL